MSSEDDDHSDPKFQAHHDTLESVGYLLFDSLVHHLIEKGVLTKNDALSVVQTVAEVVRSEAHGGRTPAQQTSEALACLQRTYSSFDALPVQQTSSQPDGHNVHTHGHNVHTLRPPLHDDRPKFPSDD